MGAKFQLYNVQILWRHFHYTFLVDDVAPPQGSKCQSRFRHFEIIQEW